MAAGPGEESEAEGGAAANTEPNRGMWRRHTGQDTPGRWAQTTSERQVSEGP